MLVKTARKHEGHLHAELVHRPRQTVARCAEPSTDEGWELPTQHEDSNVLPLFVPSHRSSLLSGVRWNLTAVEPTTEHWSGERRSKETPLWRLPNMSKVSAATSTRLISVRKKFSTCHRNINVFNGHSHPRSIAILGKNRT